MKKFIISCIVSSLYLTAISQNFKSADIPGTWQLSKHTITVNGTAVDRLDANLVEYYIFYSNGTYKVTSKNGKSSIVNKGKWKVVNNGAKVRLYNNKDVPDDPKTEISDHDLVVKYLNGVYYLTYTSGDVPNPPNVDYFKKIIASEMP